MYGTTALFYNSVNPNVLINMYGELNRKTAKIFAIYITIKGLLFWNI